VGSSDIVSLPTPVFAIPARTHLLIQLGFGYTEQRAPAHAVLALAQVARIPSCPHVTRYFAANTVSISRRNITASRRGVEFNILPSNGSVGGDSAPSTSRHAQDRAEDRLA
jgi:hypothetical protein